MLDQWRHVGGEFNPGDDLSMGLSAMDEGAEISLDADGDVASKPHSVRQYSRYRSRSESGSQFLCVIGKRAILSCSGVFPTFSWFLRYRENLRAASKGEKPKKSHERTILPVSVEEMRVSELEILKDTQCHHFPEEMRSLTRPGSTVKKSSCLRSLDPSLVDSLLRVGGRLRLAQTSFDSKHQIILPKNDHVSNLLIEHFHLISGKDYVLSLLRERFWERDGECVQSHSRSTMEDCNDRPDMHILGLIL